MKTRIEKTFGLIRCLDKRAEHKPGRAFRTARGELSFSPKPAANIPTILHVGFPVIGFTKPRKKSKRTPCRVEAGIPLQSPVIAKKLGKSRKRVKVSADLKVDPASLRAGMMAPRRKAPNKA